MVNSHTIDLSYGVRHALRALRSSLRHLGSLEEVSITRPGRYAGSIFADELLVIFKALCCLPGLQSVSVSFDDTVLPVFVLTTMLEGANDLVELGIFHVRLSGDAEDFEAMEQALQEHQSLEDVKLVCCKIHNDATKAMGCKDDTVPNRQTPRMFCRPRNLRRLWLHDCHDSHIVAVAEALQEHQTNLKELSIVSSKVGDPGVESISQMLKRNTSLEQLEVTLFKGPVLRVAESIHDGSTLRKLTCNILIPECKPTLVTDGPKRI